MGAGKTTIGRRVADSLGLPFYDLDHVIEASNGASVALIFELEGEAGFRKRECAALDEYSARRGIVLATGGGAVLDPFLGSGTVALAALAEGRKAIGVERFPKYAEICRARIAKALDVGLFAEVTP